MRFWLTAAGVLILDRLSKIWIMNHIQSNDNWVLIDGILNFTYLHNRGAAFGIMQGRAGLFLVMAALVIAAAVYYNSKYHPAPWMQYSLGLIVGGALGNLIDRLIYRSVVDFISVGWFPVFNVADIAITCGGALFMLYVIKTDFNEAAGE